MLINEKGSNISNLSRGKNKALFDLKKDTSIVIKEADKGSAVVVWDREDYLKEADSQLSNKEVYQEVMDDPLPVIDDKIKSCLEKIHYRGDIGEKALEYFKVRNPKLGRFYLLPKIHKRLENVPGRPVISNSGYYTENISCFFLFPSKAIGSKSGFFH